MTTDAPSHNAVDHRTWARPALLRVAGLFACVLLLNGCGSVGAGVGFSVPVFPGVSVGIGVGSDGPSVGVTAGTGPVGVGVNQRGQVTGGVGLGVGTELGNSGVNAGVGVGTGTVLYDPDAHELRQPRRP